MIIVGLIFLSLIRISRSFPLRLKPKAEISSNYQGLHRSDDTMSCRLLSLDENKQLFANT